MERMKCNLTKSMPLKTSDPVKLIVLLASEQVKITINVDYKWFGTKQCNITVMRYRNCQRMGHSIDYCRIQETFHNCSEDHEAMVMAMINRSSCVINQK